MWLRRSLRPVSLGIVVMLISFVSLVVGELTPKALALRNPERWAALVAAPIGWLVRVLSGPSRVLTWAARLILTVLGLRDAPLAPVVSEEEVKYLVREGTAQGVFEPGERDLVNRVFQFTDTPVRLVMWPSAMRQPIGMAQLSCLDAQPGAAHRARGRPETPSSSTPSPHRVEPRITKRRPTPFPWMLTPRQGRLQQLIEHACRSSLHAMPVSVVVVRAR